MKAPRYLKGTVSDNDWKFFLGGVAARVLILATIWVGLDMDTFWRVTLTFGLLWLVMED